MKILGAILAWATSFCAVAGPPPFACPSGGNWVPWQLDATPYAETPIFAGDQNKRVATVCNCTEKSASANAGVWIVSIQPLPPGTKSKGPRILSHPPGWYQQKRPMDAQPPAQGGTEPPPLDMEPGPGNDVYYLQGGSCSVAGPGSVILRTADHRAEKWGVWRLEPGS